MTWNSRIEMARNISVVILALTLSVCSVGVYRELKETADKVEVIATDARPKVKQILTETQGLVGEARKIVKAQSDEWFDPRASRARLHAQQVGDHATVALNTLAEQVELTGVEVRQVMRNFDTRVNGELLPQTTSLVASMKVTAETFNVELEKISLATTLILQDGRMPLQELTKLLASPDWLETVKNVAASSKSVDKTLENIAVSSERIPNLTALAEKTAGSVEKIMAASSRNQKLLFLAQLFATIAGVVF